MSDSPLSEIEQGTWDELAEKDLDDLEPKEITAKLRLSVKRRFSPGEWVLMYEFPDPHGSGRLADVIAVNTLPSRNYKIVGFELKATRDDWLKEKKNGSKADPFVRIVDEWYVVAPKGILEQHELPAGWGYLEMKPNSEQLYKLREAELTEHQQGEPPRRFWMKFLEKTVGGESNFSRDDLKEAMNRGYQKAQAEIEANEHPDINIDRLQKKANSYDKLRDRFDPIPWNDISEERLKTLELAWRLVKKVEGDSFGTIKKAIEDLDRDLERRVEDMQESIDYLDEGIDVLAERVQEGKVPPLPDDED